MIDSLILAAPAVVALGSLAGATLMPAKRDTWLGLAYVATMLFFLFLVGGGDSGEPPWHEWLPRPAA